MLASKAKSKNNPENPKTGTSANVSQGMIKDGTVLVKLKNPRSRPRVFGFGSTRKVCAVCCERNTVPATPKIKYPAIAMGNVGDIAMINNPTATMAAHQTSGMIGF